MKLKELYEETKYTIALDCDGVIADFEKAIEKIHGPDWKSLSLTDFWKPISFEIDNFYSTLDPFPKAKKFYETLKSLPEIKQIYVLTALPRPINKAKTAKEDKINWVHKYIDPNVRVETVVGSKNKGKFCSGINDILIDDKQGNIDVWKKAGGIGILHTSIEDTLTQLQNLITSYQK